MHDTQLKGLSMVVFVLRFIAQLREEAQEQLNLDRDGANVPFVSDGDVITAWCARTIISSRPSGRSAIIMNVFDMRRRLSNTFADGGAYLQNLILGTSVFLPAAAALSTSRSQIALKLRKAIIEQTTDAQTRSLLNIARRSYTSSGGMPLFGSSDSVVIASTNWSKAGIREAADFSAAVVDSSQLSAVVKDGFLPYWGTTISVFDNPRDTIVIYGKDGDGDYWAHGYLRTETWDLIQGEFSQYI
ncbi:hypothetical protein DL769_003538 [Monosporascus sp. CRB-8-3]|nr:hypothetical protein DL769_003538 [Monosporascus sp. CRB-8-3]